MVLGEIDSYDANDDRTRQRAVVNNIEMDQNSVEQGLRMKRPFRWEFDDNSARRVRHHSHSEKHVQLALTLEVGGYGADLRSVKKKTSV